MDVTKHYRFIGFGAMDVTKPYRFIGFGATDVTKPYKFIRFSTKTDLRDRDISIAAGPAGRPTGGNSMRVGSPGVGIYGRTHLPVRPSERHRRQTSFNIFILLLFLKF